MSVRPWPDPGVPVFQPLPARPAAPAGSALVRYQCTVLGCALFAIYANLPIFAYTWQAALLPKYAFILIFLAMAPLALARPQALVDYLLSPFALWAGALVVLNVVHLSMWADGGDAALPWLVDRAGEARAALVSTRIQYVLFALMLGFVAWITPTRGYLVPVAVLMLVLPCAVLLDFARPGLFYPTDTIGAVTGRAAATFINPTMAGEALLHVFLLGCALVRGRWRGALFMLVGAAVLATFSRSSIIAWCAIMAILVARRSLPRAMVVAALAALAGLVLGIGAIGDYLYARDGFDGAAANILSRLAFFSNFSFGDDSSAERAGVIRAAWLMFQQHPVFGAGAGATLFWEHRGGTHNQVLMFAAEYGLFGIALWAWLIVIVWRGRFFRERALQAAMLFLVAFMSLFTHQMLDGASYWLATFALLAVRAGPAMAVHGRFFYQPVPGAQR